MADEVPVVTTLIDEGALEDVADEVGRLARGVSGSCCGLPLALITIGRAMAIKNTTIVK